MVSAGSGTLGKPRKTAHWLLATSLSLVAVPASAQVPLRQAIDELIRRSPAGKATIALRVIRLPAGQVLYSFNADKPMTPASNAKLLVTAAAAVGLGQDFHFRTLLARRGQDLVILGGGDPATADPKLAQQSGVPITAMFHEWAEALADAGWTDIPGDLIFDDSVFDDCWRHPNWPPEEVDHWYAAPVGGLNCNDNCLTVTLRPSRPGTLIEVQSSPRQTAVPVVNRCRTGGKQSAVARRSADGDGVLITGLLKKPVTVEVAVRDPGLFSAAACRTALAAKGIRITGQTRRARVRQADGSLPAGVEVLAEHRTPLAVILPRCNKSSQNLFAECLLKTLGRLHQQAAGQADAVGSWSAGQQAVHTFLQDAGLPTAGVVIDDGSGLSRQNRVTARLMTELLGYVYGQPPGELFVESLSVSGRDGTLKRRLGGKFEGCLLGKTGYLRGVRTLSGYVINHQGQWLSVSILINGFAGSSKPFTQLQDEVCRLLVQADLPPPSKGGY